MEKPLLPDTDKSLRAERKQRLLKFLAPTVGAFALTGAAYQSGVERSLTDRPDELQGRQVHPVYVVPADGKDRQLDTNGKLEEILWQEQDWLAGRGRGDGLSLRMDTYQGHPDISYLRSKYTADELKDEGLNMVKSLEDELHSNLPSDNGKVLLALYDGTVYASYDGKTINACGAADQPPQIPGNVAVVGLEQAGYCSDILSKTMVHETFHVTGQVKPTAPDYSSNGHIKNPDDIMGAAPPDLGIDSLKMDETRQNYYYDVQPWLTSNHHFVDIDLKGKGMLRPDQVSNEYLTKGNVEQNNCYNDCELWFRNTETVILSAKSPNKQWKFNKWGGACTGTKITCKLNAAKNSKITATFSRVKAAKRRR